MPPPTRIRRPAAAGRPVPRRGGRPGGHWRRLPQQQAHRPVRRRRHRRVGAPHRTRRARRDRDGLGLMGLARVLVCASAAPLRRGSCVPLGFAASTAGWQASPPTPRSSAPPSRSPQAPRASRSAALARPGGAVGAVLRVRSSWYSSSQGSALPRRCRGNRGRLFGHGPPGSRSPRQASHAWKFRGAWPPVSASTGRRRSTMPTRQLHLERRHRVGRPRRESHSSSRPSCGAGAARVRFAAAYRAHRCARYPPDGRGRLAVVLLLRAASWRAICDASAASRAPGQARAHRAEPGRAWP